MTERLSSTTAANACSGGKTAGLTIAVFLDSARAPCAPHAAVRVACFRKRGERWAEVRTERVYPPQSLSPLLVSAFMEEMAIRLKDAQAVAGAPVAGAAFTVFSRKGKHIFDIPELSEAQLGGIAEDIALEEARRTLAVDAFKHTTPAETEIEGVYSMDLVTALEEYPQLSSKMILKPFFKSTPFAEFTLICRHLPHWLPLEKHLTLETKQRGEYLVVNIQKRTCEEAML